MSNNNNEWEKVGSIGVDAGICWIGDPCYILHTEGKKKPKDIGKDWHEFCDKLTETLPEPPFERSLDTKQFNYDLGHAGLGVVVSTGYGDGSYDVFIKRDPKTNRIAEAKVVFIGDDNYTEQFAKQAGLAGGENG